MSFIAAPTAKMGVGIKYNAYDNDVIVEVMWKVFSFVHTICFPEFKQELNLHHVLETQMESLFMTPVIQQRW